MMCRAQVVRKTWDGPLNDNDLADGVAGQLMTLFIGTGRAGRHAEFLARRPPGRKEPYVIGHLHVCKESREGGAPIH